MFYILLLFMFVTSKNPVNSTCQEGYYWRDYTGVIPDDAIIGGQDANNNDLYIGQVHLESKGLMVTQIKEGETSVTIFYNYELYKSNSNIKILCGDANVFSWISVTGTDINTKLVEHRPLIGGSQSGSSIYIGRAFYMNEVHIGKVDPWFKNVPLYIVYNNNNKYKDLYSYEVLVFN